MSNCMSYLVLFVPQELSQTNCNIESSGSDLAFAEAACRLRVYFAIRFCDCDPEMYTNTRNPYLSKYKCSIKKVT